jgi:hypothetical protein
MRLCSSHAAAMRRGGVASGAALRAPLASSPVAPPTSAHRQPNELIRGLMNASAEKPASAPARNVRHGRFAHPPERWDFRASCCLTAVAIAPLTFLLLDSIFSSDSRSMGTSREAKVNGVRGLETKFSFTW